MKLLFDTNVVERSFGAKRALKALELLAYAQEIGWTYVPRAEAETRGGLVADSCRISSTAIGV